MKWLAFIALAGAQALRGPDGLQVVHEVHRRPHISLLTKRRHTELTRETVHGVDFSSLSQGEVNQGEAPSQILAGAGSFPDEAQVAAAPSAAPSPSLVARSQHKHVQEPAPPADAASFVFGGSPPQQEALTRDEVQAMHAAAPKLPVAAQRAAKPYSVTIDVPHPQQPAPMSALHAASQVTHQDMQAQAAQQQAALQQQEQQQALQQQQVQAAMQQVQQQQQFLRRTSQQQTALAATAQNAAVAQTPSGITRPKGWDQCLKFSRFIKSQGVTGMELIKTWKSSCEPAVQSGVATERYKVMCNALGGAVEPFASQQDYDVTKMCDAVLAVFHDVTAVDVRAATDA